MCVCARCYTAVPHNIFPALAAFGSVQVSVRGRKHVEEQCVRASRRKTRAQKHEHSHVSGAHSLMYMMQDAGVFHPGVNPKVPVAARHGTHAPARARSGNGSRSVGRRSRSIFTSSAARWRSRLAVSQILRRLLRIGALPSLALFCDTLRVSPAMASTQWCLPYHW